MGNEIEKKYLIFENGNNYATQLLRNTVDLARLRNKVFDEGESVVQGYMPLKSGLLLASSLGMTYDFNPVEARLRDQNGKLFFTLKGKGSLERNELEEAIEQVVFDQFWPSTKEGGRIYKHRLKMPCPGNSIYTVEFDAYLGRDLLVAEVEVPSKAEAERLIPLGRDITENDKYKNRNLAA